jgi:hypothetical protein
VNNASKICIRCQKPVLANADNYELFERMHWLCFHLEFEHEGDPDMPCSDPSCPWSSIDRLSDRLRELGEDPGTLVGRAIRSRTLP